MLCQLQVMRSYYVLANIIFTENGRKDFIMAQLDCSATNCYYNCNHGCSKGKITVGGSQACDCGDTCCESFKQGSESYSNSTKEACRSIDISCKATHCMYNKDEKCYAEHIGIAGGNAMESAETECASFRPR